MDRPGHSESSEQSNRSLGNLQKEFHSLQEEIQNNNPLANVEVVNPLQNTNATMRLNPNSAETSKRSGSSQSYNNDPERQQMSSPTENLFSEDTKEMTKPNSPSDQNSSYIDKSATNQFTSLNTPTQKVLSGSDSDKVDGFDSKKTTNQKKFERPGLPQLAEKEDMMILSDT